MNLKQWYIEQWERDNMKDKIDENLTPESMITGCILGMDIYQVIGVGDSLIRERLFDMVAHHYGVSYSEIYDACILQLMSDDLKKKLQQEG